MNNIFRIIILSVMMVAAGLSNFVAAHSPEKYTKSSTLASGNWGRVEVTQSGMQFISDKMISSMGLDPKNTHVYGYGGRRIPDRLAFSEPDDLPLIPSIRLTNGILFFGVDNITWSSTTASMKYTHEQHPYSTSAFYFLSDKPIGEGVSADIVEGDYSFYATTTPETTFTERILHEQELIPSAETGRDFLGEDFRSRTTQNFNFNLPGNASAKIRARVLFGARFSGGTASIMLSADNNRLPSTSSDQLYAAGEGTYLTRATTVKEIDFSNRIPTSFNLGITFQSSAVLSTAALDYIEVEYTRTLSADGGTLYFYDQATRGKSYSIAGCDHWTQIWDVTNPEAPIKVNYTLTGSNALFTVKSDGYREFIVFGENQNGTISPVNPVKVANQNLHALENPDMLIIAPYRYRNQANEVADIHRNLDKMTVHVLTPDVIYNEFSSGNPDVGAFRKILKMWGDRANADTSLPFPKYCLIIGKGVYDNRGLSDAYKRADITTVPIWESTGGYTESSSYCTDDYIGMIDDSDNNFSIGSQKIRVAVGRWPVTSEEEASILVQKLSDYILNPDLGSWRNNVMLIADDQDYGDHLSQTDTQYDNMVSVGNGANFAYEKLYLDAFELVKTATGDTYPEPKKRMLRRWNEGVNWINYIGHANTRSWSHEKLLTWEDINSMNNRYLPFLYAATCSFAHHDDFTPSAAEVLLMNPNGGIIGTICPSRSAYISLNGTLSKSYGYYIFEQEEDGKGRRIGDIFINGKNRIVSDDTNKLRFALLADPAMRIINPDRRVVVEKIDGVEIAGLHPSDYPVIAARQKVRISGYIANPDGSVCSDFSGQISNILFDAEKVITTNGNGQKGKVMTYNDRNTRLYAGATTVKDGRWEFDLLMPSEIENNFSTALFSSYAWSESGLEANGGCDKFYVYGYDEEAAVDNEGPEIIRFTLNNDNFAEGDITHPNSVVLASFRDPSGINISEAGVGHSMLLTLDGKTRYDDLPIFYTPDPEIEGGGSFSYSLSNLEPGDHELKLTVWDNANNSTTKVLPFRVGLNKEVEIITLTSDANPARDKVTFRINSDRILNNVSYTIEVMDYLGNVLWSSGRSSKTNIEGSLKHTWYVTDNTGSRLNRGIYLCRAIVTSDEGVESSKSIKIAVAAQ